MYLVILSIRVYLYCLWVSLFVLFICCLSLSCSVDLFYWSVYIQALYLFICSLIHHLSTYSYDQFISITSVYIFSIYHFMLSLSGHFYSISLSGIYFINQYKSVLSAYIDCIYLLVYGDHVYHSIYQYNFSWFIYAFLWPALFIYSFHFPLSHHLFVTLLTIQLLKIFSTD